MNRRLLWAALAAAALLPGRALAAPAPAASGTIAFDSDEPSVPQQFAANAEAIVGGFLSGGQAPVAQDRYYRPRYGERRYERRPMYSSPVQFHAGFFDPTDDTGTSFVGGFRAGPLVDPHIQLGVGVDWMHRAQNESEIISEQPGPGGTTITTRQQLAQSSSNLFPITAFLQVSADDRMPVIPYFGVGGGYEVLFLSATDFQTGDKFDGTFGGWAWQAWGGAAIPLSRDTRVVGEVFVNQGEVSRDTDGPGGITYHETVNVNGVGMRLGLNWGF